MYKIRWMDHTSELLFSHEERKKREFFVVFEQESDFDHR